MSASNDNSNLPSGNPHAVNIKSSAGQARLSMRKPEEDVSAIFCPR